MHRHAARFSDPGVVIQPNGDCHRIDEHTAVCRAISRDDEDVPELNVQLSERGGSVALDAEHYDGATVYGGSGNDRLDARRSHSPVLLDGDGGRDVVLGGSGNDTLVAEADDRVSGGPGDDVIAEGEAMIAPVEHNYTETACPAGPGNRIDGGAGSDTLAYNCRDAVVVDLARRTGNGPSGKGDRVTNVENATANGDRSVLRGNALANTLTGVGAHDVLNGRGGSDRLVVHEPEDLDVPGKPIDPLVSNERGYASSLITDRVRCGAGDDRLVPAVLSDQLVGDRLIAPAVFPRDCERIGSLAGSTFLRRPLVLMADGLHGIALTCTRRSVADGGVEAQVGLTRSSHTIHGLVGRLTLDCTRKRLHRSASLRLSAAARSAALHGRPLYLRMAWGDGIESGAVILPLRFDRHGRLRG